jgi:hypothetical protein
VGYDILPEKIQGLSVGQRLYAAAKAAGHGEKDLAAVVTALEQLDQRRKG